MVTTPGTAVRQVVVRSNAEKIKSIHAKSRRVYGSPRIHRKLLAEGFQCSRDRVARLMRKQDMRASTVFGSLSMWSTPSVQALPALP